MHPYHHIICKNRAYEVLPQHFNFAASLMFGLNFVSYEICKTEYIS
jgi:hypothetical protein